VLLLEHPSSASSQVQVSVKCHSFFIPPSLHLHSAAAANAPLNPPSAPAATILAPRNARSSASPIHSRGAPSPGRLSTGVSVFRSLLFLSCSEVIRSIRFQAPNVSLHVFQSHVPPWHAISRWGSVCFYGSSTEPRQWIPYSRTADGPRSTIRLVKPSAVLLCSNESVCVFPNMLWCCLFAACCFPLMSCLYCKVLSVSKGQMIIEENPLYSNRCSCRARHRRNLQFIHSVAFL
jgi:hypothetical protein